MKYTIETKISKNIETVIEAFNNVKNYEKWMPGIVSYTPLKGEASKAVGVQSKFVFKMGSKSFEIEETVLENTGTSIVSKYVSNGAINTQHTRFTQTDDAHTRYRVDESFELKGFMKIIGFLMPRSFKKQTATFVDAFKEFVENQY